MVEYIFCLYDLVAGRRIGALVVDRAVAPMIRTFHDALAQDENMRRHARDYELRLIGVIGVDGSIVPQEAETVATGVQWLAAQEPQLRKEA